MACSKVVELGTEKKVTRMVTFRKNLQWKIEKFFEWALTAGNYEDSPVFEIPLGNLGDPYRFYLRIHPRGLAICEDSGYISIYLVNESDDQLSIDYRIYLEEKCGTYVDICSEEGQNIRKTNIWGIRKAIKLSQLEEHPEKYLPNGTLTIGAIIVVQIPENVSSSEFTDSILEENIKSEETITDFFSKNFDITNEENSGNYERFSDFTIVCNDETEKRTFKCHKVFLTSRSPVFAAMLSHGTTECSGNEAVIKDVSSITMEKLLHFIYTDQIKEDMIDVALWTAADKYQIQRLKAICERHLAAELKIENAVEAGISAHLHGSDVFEQEVVRFIAQNWSDIKNTTKWEEMKNYPDLLCDILSQVAPASISKETEISTGEYSGERELKRQKVENE